MNARKFNSKITILRKSQVVPMRAFIKCQLLMISTNYVLFLTFWANSAYFSLG